MSHVHVCCKSMGMQIEDSILTRDRNFLSHDVNNNVYEIKL